MAQTLSWPRPRADPKTEAILASERPPFGVQKVNLKGSLYLEAVKRSLLLEFSGRMYLHAATRQRSNGSDGSRSVPEALLCAYGKPDRAGGPVTNTL